MVRLAVSSRPAAIAAAVAGCPAVAALSAGTTGDVASYLPGRRVVGVRKAPGGVAVHVVAWFGPTMAEVAGQVRSAVTAVAPECERIDVVIDDLELPPDGPVTAATSTAATGSTASSTAGVDTAGTQDEAGARSGPGPGPGPGSGRSGGATADRGQPEQPGQPGPARRKRRSASASPAASAGAGNGKKRQDERG
ncbi:hypothetical protein [Protofrankia symbiont of Coriaria ruscifolia]|uniref:hypothetical protein n=1 Tax=Protofrankia symbiont of Coriaria ruscifolia TaxID=1306542 RepID=UPI001A94E2C2|nr:hypothetical protein [Protofrankia symbiont of Coriaria ruscifolia]